MKSKAQTNQILPYREFAQTAHPHSWLLVADDLHQQAVNLRSGAFGGSLQAREGDGKLTGSWPAENRAVFLLAGLALENALKAFLVYENPAWVSNGTLSGKLRTHDLTVLASRVNQLPWPKRGHPILTRFERGIESWARYPCGLDAGSTELIPVLDQKLWTSYERLIGRYGDELVKRLRIGWLGPHGIDGHFEFYGKYLGNYYYET